MVKYEIQVGDDVPLSILPPDTCLNLVTAAVGSFSPMIEVKRAVSNPSSSVPDSLVGPSATGATRLLDNPFVSSAWAASIVCFGVGDLAIFFTFGVGSLKNRLFLTGGGVPGWPICVMWGNGEI